MIANSSFAKFYGTGTASEMPAGRSYRGFHRGTRLNTASAAGAADVVPMSKLNTAPAADMQVYNQNVQTYMLLNVAN